MTTRYPQLYDLQALIGSSLGTSEWWLVDQTRIDAFAAATGDTQWIHADPAQASRGPFGCTIAHGFLTLSLLPALRQSAFAIENVRMTINYGLNRVRFPAILPAPSRVRGHFTLVAFEPLDAGAQLTLELSVEREGHLKPVCVAQSLLRYLL